MTSEAVEPADAAEFTTECHNASGIADAIAAALASLRPPEKLTPVEWAEKNVRVAPGNAIPGLVRMRNAPYQAEPLNMVADPDCREITLMWGAQTGKTMVILMAMGYFIDHDPMSQMMMQPSQGDLQTWLTSKFDPMVAQSEVLSSKIATPRSRQGVNNQRMKQYPGGFLMFAWSGSPKTLRGRSAPKIYADEIDGYERTPEGSQLALIWQRAATFGDQRLMLKTSTPTWKGASEVEKSFEQGDQRRWHVDCPHCDESQHLKWHQVQWLKDDNGEHLPETARYVCEHCGTAWDEVDRIKALREGRWVAGKPWNGHASYHLPEMASLFVKLSDMVRSFLSKKASGDMQTFINVSLAETWDEVGTQHDPDLLYARRERYPAPVPAGACVLAAGVDVQDDRFEITVYGYGGVAVPQSWAITHSVLRGDPGHKELWDRLDDFLLSEFEHESGVRLRIAAVGVDTGGHYTTEAYKFCKARADRRIYALKGSNQHGAPLVGRPTKTNKVKVDLYPVGTDAAKVKIFRSIGLTDPDKPGYIHFPLGDPMIDREFFEQLTAEKQVTTYKNGFPIKVFKKKRPRNEALDCRVYTDAAIEILRPNFKAIAAKLQARKTAKKTATPRRKKSTTQQKDPLSVKAVAQRRRVMISKPKRPGFVKRY